MATPIENTLEWNLGKVCRQVGYRMEVPIGRFRVDALTDTGVAFEADGRDFHRDKEKDNRRDKWILENAKKFNINVHSIVRIPGCVLWHHEFALRNVMADILGTEWPLECELADDVEEMYRSAVVDSNYDGAYINATLETKASCYGKCESCYIVGLSTAFLAADHPYLPYVRRDDSRSLGIVEVKRLDNVRRWNPYCLGFPLGWRRRHEA